MWQYIHLSIYKYIYILHSCRDAYVCAYVYTQTYISMLMYVYISSEGTKYHSTTMGGKLILWKINLHISTNGTSCSEVISYNTENLCSLVFIKYLLKQYSEMLSVLILLRHLYILSNA